MQGIHPRFKHEVGRRLALAYRGALTPTIHSCAAKEGEIDLVWTVAENDEAIVQWGAEDSNMSAWGVQDSSGLMVCVGKPSAETTADDCLTDASLWVSAPLVAKGVGRRRGCLPSRNIDHRIHCIPKITGLVLGFSLPERGSGKKGKVVLSEGSD